MPRYVMAGEIKNVEPALRQWRHAYDQDANGAIPILAASLLDLLFAGDAEFPNRWRSIVVGDDSGRPRLGRVARLQRRARLLCESHAASKSRKVQFLSNITLPTRNRRSGSTGANLLQSKLPIIAQSIVRQVAAKYPAALMTIMSLNGGSDLRKRLRRLCRCLDGDSPR